MTQLSDEEGLVTFLKQYHPFVPLASSSLENQLMKQLSPLSQPQSFDSSKIQWWGVGSAIAASLALAWGLWQVAKPTPQVATSPEELETFLVESWEETTGETSDSRAITSDWLLLGHPEAKLTFSVD